MLITIFAYMKNRFPRHSARTVGSPTRSLSPYTYCASVGIYPNDTEYPQPPSSAYIKYAGDGANYCFGMGDGRVYIYDRAGVQAIVPLNDFVMPKIITK